MINIKLKDGFSKDTLIATEKLARKGERDGLPLSVLNNVDEDGFEVDFVDIKKLHFDNAGRYFEKPEASLKQINKVISDLLNGNEISPVIVDLKGNVLDGQHRMCAFNILGITNIPILKSLMNETVFDNMSSRGYRLGIEKAADFYSKADLENNKEFQNYKILLNTLDSLDNLQEELNKKELKEIKPKVNYKNKY